MRFSSVKDIISNCKNDYFHTLKRKTEFAICIFILLALGILQIFSSIETRSIIGQTQAFISLFMIIRFGGLGMIVALAFNFKDLIFVLSILISTRDNGYFVPFTFLVLSSIWILIMGMLIIQQNKHKKEFQRLAITDELTEVYNKRYFHSCLDSAYQNNSSIGLILIDIDNFRMHNDLYGHDYGDTVLKNTAVLLKEIVNETDKVFKFGGDEFAVLTINKDLRYIESEAKRIHEQFEKQKKDRFEDGALNRITISIGLSEYPHISRSRDELVSHADMALYQAKNMGDNKISFYQDIMLQINQSMKSDEQMIGMFKGLLSTITAKDKYTVGHCERVASYAAMIGESMGLELKEIQTLLYAGILHDIGKIELPNSILNKPGRLTEHEFELVRMHPKYSAIILEPLSGMDKLIDYVKYHHERYDGKGYPEGLAGDKIPLGARILCVADSFDAMISERPYRKSLTVSKAFLELEKHSGTQFDPNIAQTFIKIMRNQMSIKYNYKVEFNDALLRRPIIQKN